MDSDDHKEDERALASASSGKVFIVDDHPLVREGLARLIDEHDDLSVCGEADDVEQAYTGIQGTHADVVVVDLALRGDSGFELIKRLRLLAVPPRILVLSMHDESSYVERAIRYGAQGYVMKKETATNIITAIRKVLQGQLHVSHTVTEEVLTKFIRTKATVRSRTVASLSDRELEVFGKIGRGIENRTIGEQLHISLKTVQTHCHHIKKKLGLENGTALVREAVRWVEGHDGGIWRSRP